MALPGLAVALLAAGRSTRFGAADKLAADLGGRALIGWAAEAGRTVEAAHHLLVAPAGVDWGSHAPGYRLVVNSRPEAGMAHSLGLAAAAAQEAGASALMVLLADMPFVTAEHLDAVLGQFATDGASAVFSCSPEGVAQPPALFPARAFADLQALEGDRGAQGLATGSALVNADARLLLDVDTPEDLAWARAMVTNTESKAPD
ncbi:MULTISPECIES: NTP transferase domain-containing protein [Sphingobium]|uniref:NTP transferase domain-containing protein n=1 Tax=Sphingobium TaxID=165695 RepID=UPI0015EB46CD|nr:MULTISPECIES: NTP transferase domain-containing protein [Sphingobium]MCW2362405.1 molybdenum cofactor cytidylyltransferase [Sphingobium sp. B10D3B]MCW2400916.1 molybdenum cofactor cytidylyltransferase [Sphingobium sp. B10D7B]MCW2407895.1 molybdenum cofactor cytidylyltransferase [Sphingobium xanthum]